MPEKIADNSNKDLFIAVPTNDGITIFPKMLGMARYFYIYSLTGGSKFTLIEKRLNQFETTMQHLKTLDVYMVINDCEIIIAALIGKKGAVRLQEKGIKLFFRKGDIAEALNSVLKDDQFYK